MEAVLNIGREFLAVLLEMSPYLLFGFFAAGVLSVFLSAETVEKHLGSRGFGPVVKAAFWGVPMPLCSCSVIPVATSLRRHGASRGATAAFLLSTPQTGVDSILVTYSLLGIVFAVFRPLAAFLTGLVGGGLVSVLEKNGTVPAAEEPACDKECCRHGKPSSRIARAFRYGFVTLPRDIGQELFVGLLVAGLITALVPGDFFAEAVGPGLLQMLLMMAVGIPVYVCATASVPIAAALMLKGVSPGAALVFLMTGPASNAAALATVRKILGGRSAVIYLLSLAGMALVSGFALDGILGPAGHGPHIHQAHWMMPVWAKAVSTAVLLGVLAFALWPRKTAPASPPPGPEHTPRSA